MVSFGRLLSLVGMMLSDGGVDGSGRICVLGRMLWLRPDFVPPPPFLVVQDDHSRSSRIIVEPHLVDAEFREAWMPYFCRSGHPEVSAEQFLDFICHFLSQENHLDLPRITGRDLQEVARAKKATAGGLDGWAWNEVQALLPALVLWSCYSFGAG